jgi:YesN/AraC family two-component response regulator
VIALIITISFAFFQHQQYIENKKTILQECHNKVALMTQAFDEKFMDIEIVSAQIANSSWLKYASSKSDIMNSRIDYFKRKDICETIGNANDILRIAKSTAVILPQKNLAMDKVSFWECSRYFKSINLPPEILEEITAALSENYQSQVLLTNDRIDSDNGNFILVKQLIYSDVPKQLIFLYIDGRLFQQYIKTNFPEIQTFELSAEETSVYRYLADSKYGIAYHATIRSNLYNWSYSYGIDADYPNKYLNFYLISGYIVLIIIEGMVSYILTRSSYRPISRLVNKLGLSQNKRVYSLDDIENTFLDLRGTNQRLNQLSDQYYTIAKNIFLSNLLQGSFNLENITEYITRFDLNYNDQMDYMVVLLNYLGENEKKDLHQDLLELQQWINLKEAPVVLDEASKSFIFILSSDNGIEDLILQSNLIKKCIDEQIPESEFEVLYGQPYSGFIGISKSYKEARMKFIPDGSYQQTAYYYPLDQEIKIINYMKINNFDAADKVFVDIMRENLRRNLTKEENIKVTTLIFEMLYRYSNDFDIDLKDVKYDYTKLQASDDWEKVWNYVREIIHNIERIYNKNRNLNQLGNEIVSYVNENYQNSDLSQQDIADLFHISRPTVSKIFKEVTRVNFIDYLHKLRIEQAKRLFDAGETDVIRVAQQTGYENETTFKRAFRKNEAVTPREYVRMLRVRRK